MKRGEVYWVTFDPALGGEIQKARPALVVSNDTSNQTLNRVQVVPLTSNTTRVYPSEALIHVNGEVRKAMTDQIRTVSKMRISQYVGEVSIHDMHAIEDAIKIQLGL